MSFLTYFYFFLTLFLYNTNCIVSQDVPSSPCPDVFQYYQQGNGDYYGRITIPHDGSTTLNLGLNASMKGYYTNSRTVNLKITMETPGQDLIEQRAKAIRYNVMFPFQHTIPRITKIELNKKSYCIGPPEELIPGSPGVTSLWSGHTFYFQTENRNGGPQGPLPEEPDVNIGQSETNNRYPEINVSSYPSDQRFENSIETADFSRNQYQQCGIAKVSIVPLILGGTEVSDGMFPWLTAILVSHGVGYEYKCTGNLISDKHVVTAARCVYYYKSQIIQNDDILCIFGKSNLRNWATSGAVTRGVSKIQPHPEFDQDSGHGDIMIITLDRRLKFSSTLSPICLWSQANSLSESFNRKGTVAGWGSEIRNPRSDQYSVLTAKSVDIPIVPQNDCLNLDLTYYTLTSDVTFCAGQRDGTGTCIGDAGAGFMINRKGKFYLKGLASIPLLNSKGECDPNFFMIFCDVAKLTDWVKTTIRE